MAGLPEVIGLLYRSDWTRLSLSVELRSETDRAAAAEPARRAAITALAGQRRGRRCVPGRC